MHRLAPVALAATLLAPLGMAAPAHAANEITISMSSGVLYDSCGDYGFTYSARLPLGYSYSWTLELQLLGPDGNEVDSDYWWDDPTSGTGEFFLCESPNLAGNYVIQGTGKACNSNYDCVPISVSPASVSMRLPQTSTALKAKPLRPAKGESVRFNITSKDERPTGYFGTSYTTVRLQVRKGGSWRTFKKTSTNDTGRAVIKARYTGTRMKVRAVTDSTSSRTGSVSRTIRVG